MKKIISLLLLLTMIVSMVTFVAADNVSTGNGVWKQYYVSLDGSDSNDGITKPFRTFERAVEEVRKVSPQMQGDIIVNIGEGTYTFDDAVMLTPGDSGKNGYRVVYKGTNYPTFSGGTTIEGFKPSDRGDGKLWEAYVDGIEDIYNLYINENRAFVANSNYRVQALGVFDDPKTSGKNDGLYVSSADIAEYEQQDRVEFWYTTNWTFTKARVESITRDAATDDRYVVRMVQPDWNTYFESTTNYPSKTDMFVIMNAFELLDTPGEYYYDKELKKLYYYPREGEDMTTAEVITPRINTLLRIQGNGIENQVKNISFEGIRFAYTSNQTLEETDFYMSKQGTNIPDESQGALHNIPTLLSTVEINHADGLVFEGNIFLGCGVVGINMIHGVMNTKINGNAFADIGDTAVAYGHVTHHDFALGTDGVGDTPSPDAKMDLTTSSIMNASASINIHDLRYNWYYNPKYSYGAPLFITEDEFGYKSVNEYDRRPYTWDGDPNAVAKGEKQWVKYDFRSKYSVDKIMVAFNPEEVSTLQRSKYEVLLSNDKNFEAESTIVVATQIDTADDIVSYNVDTDEKYRYCMLRTTEPKTFAVTRVAVLSEDIEPYTNFVRNKNCDITNNYITRTAQGNGVIGSGSSVNAYGYDESMRMIHNEFYNLPYSATGIGYGWNEIMKGGRNNYIGYNYFHETNKILHDGGSLYLMSNQEGFVGERNYIENQTVASAGIYPDQGSSDQLWRDNVMIDVPRAISLWQASTIFRNQVYRTYATTTNFQNNSPDSIVETPILMRVGDLTPEAEKIKQEAGIEKEWQYIKELVPDRELYGFDERFAFFNPRHTTQGMREILDPAIPEMLGAVLGSDNFGILFGQYPEDVKERLTEYKDLVTQGSSSDYVKKADLNVGVREYLREVSVRRMDSYEEMLAFCRAEIDNAYASCMFENSNQASKASKELRDKAVGTYTKEAIEKFEKAVNEQAAIVEKDSDKNVEAQYAMEDLYNEFFRSILGGGFESATLTGMQSSDIDFDTHTVTLRVYPGYELNGKVPTLKLLSDKNYFGKILNESIDLVNGTVVPVYCNQLKTYVNWTVKAEYYTEDLGEFVSAFSDMDMKVNTADGETLLMPSQTVYMKQEYMENGGKLTFKPVSSNKAFSLNAVFGSAVCSELVRNSPDSRYDRMELELTDKSIILYRVTDGKKQKLYETTSNIKLNEYNEISYDVVTLNDVCTLNVTVNGKKLDEVIIPEKCAKGYMGIFTDKLPVYVK